jgi:hypothetical protein
MEVIATVRVRADTENGRPSRGRVETAAGCLRNHGFDVLHLGRFGVTVRAPSETFANEFQIDLKRDRAFVADIKPRTAMLATLIDAIEVTPPLQYFDNPATA